MSDDAESYARWIQQTLGQRLAGHADADQLLVLERLRDALASGRSTIFGATIPTEHVAAVAGAVAPAIEAAIAELTARGVIATRAPEPVRIWPTRTRAQLQALERRVARLAGQGGALGPFRKLATHGVGGLRAIGFTADGRHLLVLSSNGRGVFDARTGERVGRDAAAARDARYPASLAGIAPIADQRVPMMGLDGGVALPRETPDGWSLGVARPDWQAGVWLCPPGMDVEAPEEGAFVWVEGLEELRAAGFSADGAHLALAEQHTLHLLGR